MATGPNFLTRQRLARKFGVSIRTILRWEEDADLDLPKPALINGRSYFREDEIHEWATRRAVKKHEAA